MELNKENVVTMARSESQHMRTNSGDAVFMFGYEGLLRFADKIAKYAENTRVQQALSLTGGPAASVDRDYMHGGGQLCAPFLPWFGKPVSPQQPGFTPAPVGTVPVFGPLSIDQQFAELAVSHNKLQQELTNSDKWCKDLLEEGRKTFNDLQTARADKEQYKAAYEASQEQLRKESERVFDLSRKLQENCDLFIKIDSVVEEWRKI